MDYSALLKKYDRPVPRYTSYPTAVQFTHDISQDFYAKLLSGLSEQEAVSLYVHIPFCHALCRYCGCHTKVVKNYAPAEAYVKTLTQEIHMICQMLNGHPPVSKIHFGGGSPNFLNRSDLGKILAIFRQYFDFSPDAEIAIEVDPRLLDAKQCAALAEMGFTRISLGVQDFDPDVQKAVGRIQTFKKVSQSVADLRKAGIKKINFDLMIGLPLQTEETVQRTLQQTISLSPNRLAVFSYAHVPWMKKHQKLLEGYPMPDASARFDMMMLVKAVLEKSGYHAIGIDHFAREDDSLCRAFKVGRLRRNFQGYTDDPALTVIGFGLSSISMFEGVYVQNTADAPEYRKLIQAKKFPVQRGRILNAEDHRRREMIEKIMCGYEVDITGFPQEKADLEQMAKENLVRIDGACVKITDDGWPFARIAASCFDSYYRPQENQHARAV